MATTRIMPLHVGKGRTESRAISDIIDYVANPQKTDAASSSPALPATAGPLTLSSCWPNASTSPPPAGFGGRMM